ncbi:hypothetical protein EGW08_008087, partial [Elysia chlorotica]
LCLGLLFLLFIKVDTILYSRFFILLVFRNQITHVGLGFGELHLVHAFALLTCVPVEESPAPEHGRELLAYPLKGLLHSRVVAHEDGRHLKTARWDVAHCCLHVVWDPLNEVAAVFVLHVEHLFVHLLHGHLSAEHGGGGEIAPMPWVAGRHHILGVEHLLGELGYGQVPVPLGAAGGERREARHEEVQSREGHHVDGQFAEVGIQLARESQAGGDTGHGGGDQVIQVAVGRGGQAQSVEADVVQRFVVDDVRFVRVLN